MNANDYLAKDLLDSATARARARGHDLRSWVSESRHVYVTDCRRCGGELVVNAQPRAYELHVGGIVDDVDCKGKR